MAFGVRWTREEPRRRGDHNGRVFRRAEDPNDVVILQDVADVTKARTWLGSDEMKASLQKSGTDVEVYTQTRSIVGSVRKLYEVGSPLPATLILPPPSASGKLVCLAITSSSAPRSSVKLASAFSACTPSA